MTVDHSPHRKNDNDNIDDECAEFTISNVINDGDRDEDRDEEFNDNDDDSDYNGVMASYGHRQFVPVEERPDAQFEIIGEGSEGAFEGLSELVEGLAEGLVLEWERLGMESVLDGAGSRHEGGEGERTYDNVKRNVGYGRIEEEGDVNEQHDDEHDEDEVREILDDDMREIQNVSSKMAELSFAGSTDKENDHTLQPQDTPKMSKLLGSCSADSSESSHDESEVQSKLPSSRSHHYVATTTVAASANSSSEDSTSTIPPLPPLPPLPPAPSSPSSPKSNNKEKRHSRHPHQYLLATLPTFTPAVNCHDASDYILRSFLVRLRTGITVVKHPRTRFSKSRLRRLHLVPVSRARKKKLHNRSVGMYYLSWKPADGEPMSGKIPPRLDLATCREVRHAWTVDRETLYGLEGGGSSSKSVCGICGDGDSHDGGGSAKGGSDTEGGKVVWTGTANLRRKCKAMYSFKSLSLIFDDRTVDITAVTADSCKVLMEGFSALCYRLHCARGKEGSAGSLNYGEESEGETEIPAQVMNTEEESYKEGGDEL